jgi:hypothetical protein
MHVYKIIFLLFICTNVYADFMQITHKRWSSAFEIKVDSHFSSGVPIKEPKGTYQSIMEIKYLDRNFQIHKDCVLYRVPNEKLQGELKVVEVEVKEVCRDNILEPSNIKIMKIFNFGFKLKKQKLDLLIDTKTISYTLYNLENGEPSTLYDSGETKTAYPGIFISFNNKANGVNLLNGDICFDVDEQCNPIQRNICHLCPGSVIEVITDKCPSMYRRYCKDSICGDKGQAACIRGVKASGYTGPICIPGSPVGFCQKPYKVFCENGELICR